MVAAAEHRGNCDDNSPTRMFTRTDANTFVARALGIAMRGGRHTNEKLEQITSLKDRRIEKLRSYTEETPVYLEDVLALTVALGADGPRFLTSILAEIDMYAGQFNGASPEKIGAEIIELARKLAGGSA